jgi:WD40 repeat protein
LDSEELCLIFGVLPANSLINIARNGDYAVRVQGKDAIIHAAVPLENSHAIQFLKLKDALSSQIKFLRFFNCQSSGIDDEDPLDLVPRTQLACASETRVSVWRCSDLLAEIENIEPAIANCDFGASEDELLVFHTWGTKSTVFHLSTGQSFVIKSPKFSHANGYGYRPNTKQLAILLKPDANDVLTIHERQTYEVIGKAILSTVDAQGLKWSPDGRWIAIWEVASAGTKVLLLAGDGQLYRTYSGMPASDHTHDLGIRSLEWAPLLDGKSSPFLAIGKCDGTIDLLNTRTVSELN